MYLRPKAERDVLPRSVCVTSIVAWFGLLAALCPITISCWRAGPASYSASRGRVRAPDHRCDMHTNTDLWVAMDEEAPVENQRQFCLAYCQRWS